MRSHGIGRVGTCFAGVCLVVAIGVRAQERQSTTPDPRVGLKAGFRDAGEAAWNMELVKNLPKPDGFFDPKAPHGRPAPPERQQPAEGADAAAPGAEPPAGAPGQQPAGQPGGGRGQQPSNTLSFTNSDLAFTRHHVIMGSYHGFNTYNIEDPTKARLLASVVCPGGQGDVSVYGHLLFMSVQDMRGRLDCGLQGIQTPISAERFRGVRIFDITDLRAPKQIAAVQTCRGSHTHTLVPNPNDKSVLYVYGSGTSAVRSGEELTGCSTEPPDKDPNTALFSIDVIEVPLAAPQNAKIVNRPRIFADPATGNIAGLWQGGNHGPGT
ncbi:MAG: hypothetical protein HY654_06440, partial [Acidobacteria bacterium]|nr:hypothetical protein [Acidobacteriota bacterium]